jgi:starvation-inducible DNA-binding protein
MPDTIDQINTPEGNQMDELVQSLKKVLANEFAFFLKAQNFHWNVEGPDFFQYHGLFGTIYTEVYGSIDVLAEQIRALGAYSPGSFKRFSELADIEDQIEIPSARSMIEKLLTDNTVISAQLEQCFELAEANHKHGLSDVIAARQDAHAKHGWMLTATLKNR